MNIIEQVKPTVYPANNLMIPADGYKWQTFRIGSVSDTALPFSQQSFYKQENQDC